MVRAPHEDYTMTQRAAMRQLDADRAVVECYNGMFKRMFKIFGESGFRIAHVHVRDLVRFCLAVFNHRQMMRGRAGVAGAIRPLLPIDVGVPAGMPLQKALMPRRFDDDLLTGLTPESAAQLSKGPNRRVWPGDERFVQGDL
jgi:hypothetical protein